MPDDKKPDLNAGTIPPKPRDIDEAAQNFEKNERAAQERNRQIGREHEARQQQEQKENREAAGRRAEGTQKPGPAERLYGKQDMQNEEHRVPVKPDAPKLDLTDAQRQMEAKRAEARQKDLEVLARKREPEKVPELPRSDRSR